MNGRSREVADIFRTGETDFLAQWDTPSPGMPNTKPTAARTTAVAMLA